VKDRLRMLVFWVARTRGFTAYCALAVLNVIHPLVHHLEGGSLDAILPYLNLLAMEWEATRGYRG
jgi:hypothetical protein